MNIVESMKNAFTASMDSMVGRFSDVFKEHEDWDYVADKFQAISMSDCRKSPPMIEDTDPDMDRLEQNSTK